MWTPPLSVCAIDPSGDADSSAVLEHGSLPLSHAWSLEMLIKLLHDGAGGERLLMVDVGCGICVHAAQAAALGVHDVVAMEWREEYAPAVEGTVRAMAEEVAARVEVVKVGGAASTRARARSRTHAAARRRCRTRTRSCQTRSTRCSSRSGLATCRCPPTWWIRPRTRTCSRQCGT